MDRIIKELERPTTPEDSLPLMLRAKLAEAKDDLDAATKFLRQALEHDPEPESAAFRLSELLLSKGRSAEVAALVTNLPLAPSNKSYFLLRAGDNAGVIAFVTKTLGDSGSDPSDMETPYLIVNRAIAYKRLKRIDEMNADLDALDRMAEARTDAIRFKVGIAALRGDKSQLLHYLEEAVESGRLEPSDARVFPVFEDFKDDPDFLTLVDRLSVIRRSRQRPVSDTNKGVEGSP